MTASAADTTVNAAFPSADKVVKQAATLLGCKYLFGAKGYSGVYKTAADLKALDESYIRNQGIDCSGLVYYTLTHLGYKTSGFSTSTHADYVANSWNHSFGRYVMLTLQYKFTKMPKK